MAEEKLEIVDAHMHLWSPSTHPWVEKVKDGGHPAGKFGMKSACIDIMAVYNVHVHVLCAPLGEIATTSL